jgi:pseudomonalisin/xanthomonalisin
MQNGLRIRGLVGGAAVAAVLSLVAASGALALPGAAPVLTNGASAQGAAGGSGTIMLALAPRNAGELGALAAGHGVALQKGQFEQGFSPSPGTVQAVEAWASVHGLQVSGVSADRLLVTLAGSRSALGSALGVTFERYRAADGSEFVASTGTATLPWSLAGSVLAIEGLSSLGRVHGDVRRASSAATGGLNYPTSYSPQELWSLYHAPSSQTGSGQQVSVITAGDLAQPKADLRTFEHKFGLPEVTWNQINVGAASSETEGDDEWDLDTQYSTGFAPGAGQLNVYVGHSMENSDILATIDRWVTDDATSQASFSAGECELLAEVSGFHTALDAILAEAAAQGQTLFTSSGDTGSQCPAVVGVNGVPLGIPGPNFPASSPSAIGVGGTSVLGPGEEIGWYAGGGGSSVLEEAPAFQTSAGGSFLGVRRGEPDVALDADPESGYRVIVNGEELTIGGTSAGAPSWQGIWARTEAAAGGALGFAGPVLYETEPAGAFNDIVVGDNTLYPCTPGWDYVTGRGTPDIEALIAGA